MHFARKSYRALPIQVGKISNDIPRFCNENMQNSWKLNQNIDLSQLTSERSHK